MKELNKYVFLIIVLTALVYSGSLKNSFVGDDVATIVNNGFIKDWENLPLVFSRAYLTSIKDLVYMGTRDVGAGEIFYRPAVTLSYFVDYHIWELKPFGYHLTNLLLHITNALLLFCLVNLMTARPVSAMVASLVFALHPVNTEAVSAVCFREDLLAFLFFISSFLLYIASVSSAGVKKIYTYCASLAAFFLALFSKEMAVTLPAILVLYDYYFLGKNKRGNLFAGFKSRHFGYLIVLVFYLWVWGVVFHNPNPLPGYPGGSFYTNILTMSKVIADYIRWMVWPVQLHFMVTERHLTVYHFTPAVFVSFLIISGSLVAAVKLFKRAKGLSFSIMWFFITLLPVLNIFPIIHIVGLRYLYIPIAGFCIFAAFIQLRLSGLRTVGKIIIIAILLFYSVLSMARIRVWKDNIALWSEIASWYPDNHFAHYGLGEVFLKNGQVDRAIEEFKISLSLNPQDSGLYYNLGELYVQAGRNEEAVDAYKKAIEVNPRYLEAYNNLASLYAETNRLAEAMSLWNKAVEIDPRFSIAHFNLAVFYFQDKQYGLAIRHSDAVVKAGDKIDPVFLELLKPYRK